MLLAAQILFWLHISGLIVGIIEDKEKDYTKSKEKTFEQYLSSQWLSATLSILFAIIFGWLIWMK